MFKICESMPPLIKVFINYGEVTKLFRETKLGLGVQNTEHGQPQQKYKHVSVLKTSNTMSWRCFVVGSKRHGFR